MYELTIYWPDRSYAYKTATIDFYSLLRLGREFDKASNEFAWEIKRLEDNATLVTKDAE